MAVALLARRPEPLNDLVKSLRSQNPSSVLEAFPTDTQPDNLKQAFASIKAHESFSGLKLKVAIFSVKNSSKKPFMEETFDEFMAPLESYVGGAMVFAQESLRRMFEDHGEKTLAEGAEKKGTIIFTGTLVCFFIFPYLLLVFFRPYGFNANQYAFVQGALRCNAEYGSYGASRGSYSFTIAG
jgi:short-subunit dehydrogenase